MVFALHLTPTLATLALAFVAAAEGLHMPPESVRVRKVDDRVIHVSTTIAARRDRVFAALTQPEHQAHWMSASGFTLAESHVDGRAGGDFRYVYARPGGKRIEVRGAYSDFDPPRGFSYVETYDFSPLRIEVTVALEESGGKTRYTQTLRYASKQQRDEDFEGVATSTRESMAKLAKHVSETLQDE
jgi:uncharacterized protein YndB with AHSA1/START domain